MLGTLQDNSKIYLDHVNMLKTLQDNSKTYLDHEKGNYYKKMWPFLMKYNNEVIKHNWKISDSNKKILKIKHMMPMIDNSVIIQSIYVKLQNEFYIYDYHNERITKNEIDIIMMDHSIHALRIMIETLKNISSLFFADDHIDRQGSSKIYASAIAIGYTHEKAIKYNKLFFTDMRNAISHNKYYYKINEKNEIKSFVWFDNKNKRCIYNRKKLVEISKNIRTLIYIFNKMGEQKYGKNFISNP